MSDIQKSLEILGFTDSEISVFLKLSKIGSANAANLAIATGLNRTTVYSILKQLVAKGVVIEDMWSAKRMFHIAPTENIKLLLSEEIVAFKKKEEAATVVSEAIQQMSKTAEYVIPKIQFVTEDRLKHFLYQRTPIWNESLLKTKQAYWGFQEKTFVEKYSTWIDWYWKEAPKDIVLKLISNDSTAEQEVAAKGYSNRHIAFWKDGIQFSSTLWIMGEYIVSIVLNQEPNYLVEIHDAVLAKNLSETFKGIWDDLELKRHK